MSRVGKKLVTVPNGVEINIAGTKVDVKGPKGQLSINLPDAITIKKNEDGTYSLDRATEETKKPQDKKSVYDKVNAKPETKKKK